MDNCESKAKGFLEKMNHVKNCYCFKNISFLFEDKETIGSRNNKTCLFNIIKIILKFLSKFNPSKSKH